MEFLDFNNKDAVTEYEKFVEGHPKGHFAQSVHWAGLKSEWKHEAVITRDASGSIKGTMLVLIRPVPVFPATILYSPRGPVCDLADRATISELVEGVNALAKKYKAYVFKMDTDVKSDNIQFKEITSELGFKLPKDSKNFEAIQPRYVFRLPLLGRDADQLLSSFHQKTRYNIRLAVKKGVVVKLMDKSALGDFHRIMLETGLRDNFIIRSKAYFEKLMDSLGEHARLYMAYLDGKAIAGTLAIGYGDKVWYLYGASSNAHRNVMPNYLLQFEMIKWAVERGARIYDFRGVSGDISEDNPLYGLYRFKKGFGGEFCEFIGELNYVYRPFVMRLSKTGERLYKKYNRLKFKLKNK